MRKTVCTVLIVLVIAAAAAAQTTSFTYQGSLKSNGVTANGNYDFEFALFDALNGGAQTGATLSRSGVAVTDGVFSVDLDFGANFPGAARFLEVRVRPAGGGAYTTLAPRQAIASAPYSIKSLSASNATNADQLGGTVASQFVQTTDTRLTDARQPLPNSVDYVQNRTTPQASTNFNVSGDGTAGGTLSGGIVNSDSVYKMNGITILSLRGVNGTAIGFGAGVSNTSGLSNTFVGTDAGRDNIFGVANVFLGVSAGTGVQGGSFLSYLGVGAKSTDGLINSTALGARSLVTQSNSLVLGSINGVNNATSDTNVGIGTTAPTNALHIRANGGDILFGDGGCPSGSVMIGFQSPMTGCTNYAIRDDGAGLLLINRPVGKEIRFREGNGGNQVVINPGGTLRLNFLGAATAAQTPLCRNSSNEVASCAAPLNDTAAEQLSRIDALERNLAEQAKQIKELKALLCAQNAALCMK